MSQEHRCWRFTIADAVRLFDGLGSLSDVLSGGVTERVALIGRDPRFLTHLRWARLDPTYPKDWDAILNPEPDDSGFEQAAAARSMVLLMEACTEIPGIQAARSYLIDHLIGAGWSKDDLDLAIWGRPLASFFHQHVPALAATTEQSRAWLQGGWLDATTASRLRREFDHRLTSATAGVKSVAVAQGKRSGLPAAWHEELARAGLDELRTLLSQPAADQAVWIIDD